MAERFWSKVDKSGDCWTWKAFCNPAGYGMFRLGNRMPHAQRVAWMLTCGPIPDGLHVLHRCDNPPCVNPDHLFLGTNADNVADKVAKGRSHAPQPKKRGEGHPQAKLTLEQVQVIRGSTEMANRYGVCPATICNIRKGKIWRHV